MGTEVCSCVPQLSALALQRIVRRCTALESADFSYSGKSGAKWLCRSPPAPKQHFVLAGDGFRVEAPGERAASAQPRRGCRTIRGSIPASASPRRSASGSTEGEPEVVLGAEMEGEESDLWMEEGGGSSVGSLRCGWEPLQLLHLWVRGWSRVSVSRFESSSGRIARGQGLIRCRDGGTERLEGGVDVVHGDD